MHKPFLVYAGAVSLDMHVSIKYEIDGSVLELVITFEIYRNTIEKDKEI